MPGDDEEPRVVDASQAKALAEMKTLRTATKRSLSRIKIAAMEKSSEWSPIEIECRLGLLETYFKQFVGVQNQIDKFDLDEDNYREEVEEIYIVAKSKLTSLINPHPTSAGDSFNASFGFNCTKSPQVFPQTKIPKFSGNYADFPNFIGTFERKVDQNTNYDDLDRFNILMEHLTGAAKAAIGKYEIEAKNYRSALNKLKQRFDNKNLIFSEHISALFEIPNVTKDSGSQLRKLVDDVNAHVGAMIASSPDKDGMVYIANAMIIHLVVQKLDWESRNKWEEVIDYSKLSTWEECKAVLEKRCKNLEAREVRSGNISISEERKVSNNHRQGTSKNKSKFKSTALTTAQVLCAYCNKNTHIINNCEEFQKLRVLERFNAVKRLSLCINCFEKGHSVRMCTMAKCTICSGPHHQLLHRYNMSKSSLSKDSSSTNPAVSQNSLIVEQKDDFVVPVAIDDNSKHALHTEPSLESRIGSEHLHTFLATAEVYVSDKSGIFHPVKILLDSASHLNFITMEAVQRLGLRKRGIDQQINGIGDISTKIHYRTEAVMKSKFNNFEVFLELLVLPSITGKQPDHKIDISNWEVPSNVNLADETFNIPSKIDLLVGAGHFFDLLSVGQIKLGNGLPVMQKTLLGWIVSGGGVTTQLKSKVCNVAVNELNIQNKDLNKIVERFWELESMDEKNIKWTEEQSACEKHFVENVYRLKNGRFQVKLPFKLNPELLGDSLVCAQKRFYSLERKLSRYPELKNQYSSFLREYESLGHMEIVRLEELPLVKYYAPHQGVLRPDSSSTKLRVVFDCSSKSSSSYSLNDLLMKGPTVQDELYSIILRFRFGKFALTADISKMYRQILVDPVDANYQCILWRNQPNETMKTYRLKTLTYGTTSAPFAATRCLKLLADENEYKYPLGSKIIKSNFYMDDLICSADTEKEIDQIIFEVTTIFKSAQLELRKWYSNLPSLLQQIPESEREVPLRINDSDVIKTLGIIWEPVGDVFRFVSPEFGTYSKITKRIVLSEMSMLFDPLGWINPIVVRAKVFIQHLWKLKIKWDESLSMELHTLWTDFREQLKQLTYIQIPRPVLSLEKVKFVEIHGFSDASLKAYGACVYVRSVTVNGNVQVHLLSAKSRVTPVKTQTLARLELCAAELLVDLLEKVMHSFETPTQDVILWVDATIVLAWIAAHASTWKIFVSNRVSKIQEKSKHATWRHVPSDKNPADIISKGASVEELISSIWFKGPDFLYLSREYWPTNNGENVCFKEEDLERKKFEISLIVQNSSQSFDYIFKQTFALQKFCRIIAFVFRFIEKLKDKVAKTKPVIVDSLLANETSFTPEELERALLRVVWYVQQTVFFPEIQQLKKGNDINTNSRLKTLNPFLANCFGVELLRVGGRLINAELSYDAKQPILLPKDHQFTKMYVTFLHLSNHHAGPQALVAFIRQKFWIINAREVARFVVRKCVKCFRCRPILQQQIMGNLPTNRLNPTRPFLISGVDFCGPVQITYKIRGKRPYKSYIAVFVCFSTKAVHLELVSDLTSDAFIGCLKRFISRRGLCQHLYCDNGTNFVGARRELAELKEKFLHQQLQAKIASWCAADGVQFHHIPPNAPHFGGLWEAAVKSAKHHLYRTLGNALLTFEEMTTVLAEIEAVLNSRPLCPMSSDPNDDQVLTPGHFLIGCPINALPEPICSNETSHVTRWRRISMLKQKFWQRWKNEYLLGMQHRYKWKSRQNNVKLGSIVQIADGNIPPQQWLLGRIVNVIKAKEGEVRVVDVKAKGNIYRRPIHRVAVLPIEIDIESTEVNSRESAC